MLYEINDRNVWDALGLFDEAFDEIVRVTRKPTNKGICQSEWDCCNDPANNTWEITTTKSSGLKFDDLLDDIEHVIFNDPATIVTFKDGTKVCVKACKGDTFSKETGLVYAIVKRLYANDTDDNGYLKSRGLGEKIKKIIDGAFDQKKANKERKAKKAKKSKLDKLANEVSEQAAKEAVNQTYGESSSQNPD